MSKDRYRELFERSADAILIIEGNQFVDCNDATVRMLRFNCKEEVFGTHPSVLSPERQPDGRLSVEKADELIHAAFTIGSQRFEWIHKRADGTLFPVEVLLTALPDENRPTLHVVWRDISERKKVENDLLRLISIVQSTNDLVATASSDGQILYVNNAGRGMVGLTSDENVSNLSISDFHPDWAFRIIQKEGILEATEKGLWMGETAVINRDGHEIPVSQVIMAHKTPQGKLEYLSTIMRDISGPKRAERFLNNILNTVADPIFVKDEKHRFIAVNESLCDFVGISREALLYRSDDDFFPSEQAREFRSKDEDVFRSGKENINEEMITNAQGVSHYISTKKSVFTDESGHKFLVGVIRDITELKNAQKKLRDNLQLLDSIINNLPVCVKLVSKNGILLEMNPSGLRMVGVTVKSSAIGRDIYQIISEEDRDAYRLFNEQVCNGRGGTMRFTIVSLDGARRIMESVAVPFPYGHEGQIVQLGIAWDITEQLAYQEEKKKLEKRLFQSQKIEAIGTLAGGIAHDFNNILSAIIGYTELAKLETVDGSPVINHLNQVLKASDRAKELARQILTFSRQTETEQRPTQLHFIGKEVLKLLRASIPSTIQIVDLIDRNSGTVLADNTQIHQVIMNLCTNAYHAMRKTGGVLTLEIKSVDIRPSDSQVLGLELSPGPHVVIRVSDTGHGMDRNVLERIFDPYFTTKSKDEGTGMGLAVVHGIIKSHHGHISVRSTPGKGSTFEVFFPKIESASAIPTKEEKAIPGGSERILVVDDEKTIVDTLKPMLEALGYRVTATTSCLDAEQLFSTAPHEFDLVITDMTMPGMTGAELSGKLLAKRKDIPIVLCTGFSELMNEEKAKAIGIREFVIKPVVLAQIARTVRKVLDGGGSTPH